MGRTTAIIGGGYSGAMLAVRLAESGATAVLIEKSGEFARGAAYGTRCDSHVLNVRSGRMSARADDPDHFVRWLTAHHPALADPQGFAPRRLYGDYLQAILAETEATAPGTIVRVAEPALGVTDSGVRMPRGRNIEAEAVVLATGNPEPAPLGVGDHPNIIANPWAAEALETVRPSDSIVLLGAGLTMIDVMLALEDRGWVGRAVALSRRGLLPRPHDPAQTPVEPLQLAAGPLSARLREVRRRSAADGWGAVMDRLRHGNAETWAALSAAERARFLRHLRPMWDVHRHRLAPEPAGRIDRLLQDQRLVVAAGRIARVEPTAAGVEVLWTRRGEARTERLTGDRLVNCTGPGYREAAAADRLLAGLTAEGLARPDALGLGLDVTVDGALIGADGTPSTRLFALGPPARAALWECTAVPDIRERIEALAARLAA